MLSFSILGFPVRVHWMFWVVAGLLSGALSMQGPELFVTLFTWIPIVFVSILWHELGHAQAQKKYGGRPEILLYGMGGLASASVRVTRHQSMWISAAGPAASISLYLMTFSVALVLGVKMAFSWYGAYVPSVFVEQTAEGPRLMTNSTPELLRLILNGLFFVNGFWTLINILPVLPLDGGQFFEALTANRKPGLAPRVGTVVAGIVSVLALMFLKDFYLAIFFGFLAYTNWQRSKGVHSGFW